MCCVDYFEKITTKEIVLCLNTNIVTPSERCGNFLSTSMISISEAALEQFSESESFI
jgi:hypothetical protein